MSDDSPSSATILIRRRFARTAVWLSFSSIVVMVLGVPFTRGGEALLWAVLLASVALLLALEARRASGVVLSASAIVFVLWVTMAVVDRPRGGSNEASAIGSLRAINSGQASYASACAAGGYATDLADLVRAVPNSAVGFVSPDLNKNGVVKSGYVITLTREASAAVDDVVSPSNTCNGSVSQPASSYFASANPVSKQTGARYFATDARGTIFFSTSGPIPNPIPPNAREVQ